MGTVTRYRARGHTRTVDGRTITYSPARIWTDEDIERIEWLVLHGLSAAEIGTYFDPPVTADAMIHAMRRRGIYSLRPPGRVSNAERERWTDVRTRYEEMIKRHAPQPE